MLHLRWNTRVHTPRIGTPTQRLAAFKAERAKVFAELFGPVLRASGAARSRDQSLGCRACCSFRSCRLDSLAHDWLIFDLYTLQYTGTKTNTHKPINQMLARAAPAPASASATRPGQDTERLEAGGAFAVRPPPPHDEGKASGGVTLAFHKLGKRSDGLYELVGCVGGAAIGRLSVVASVARGHQAVTSTRDILTPDRPPIRATHPRLHGPPPVAPAEAPGPLHAQGQGAAAQEGVDRWGAPHPQGRHGHLPVRVDRAKRHGCSVCASVRFCGSKKRPIPSQRTD